MLSSFMQTRKQLESWGRVVPALKRVGEAWVNQHSDIRLYVCVCVLYMYIPGTLLTQIVKRHQALKQAFYLNGCFNVLPMDSHSYPH